MTWSFSVRSAALLSFMAGAIGCASGGPDEDPSGSHSSPVYGGTASTSHSEVVLLQNQNGNNIRNRTGVLLAPRLALTALEAVVKSVDYGNGATVLSAGVACGVVGATVDPSTMTVKINDGSTRAVTAIITSGLSDTCQSGDLAFLVLDKPVDGVTFPKLELDQAPAANAPVTGCGWGGIDTKCNLPTTSAFCGEGTIILPTGGYYAPNVTKFPSNIMLTSVPMCIPADQGGPFYDAAGGLLGILSANFNADKTKEPTLQDPCLYCEGAVSSSALLSTQAAFVASAYAAVGTSPWREGHPEPAAVGAACTDALDCTSQLCVGVGSGHYCSQECESSACPSATVCTAFGSRSVCLPEVTPHPASCDVVASPASDRREHTATFAAAAFALIFITGRRRARRKQKRGRVSL